MKKRIDNNDLSENLGSFYFCHSMMEECTSFCVLRRYPWIVTGVVDDSECCCYKIHVLAPDHLKDHVQDSININVDCWDRIEEISDHLRG